MNPRISARLLGVLAVAAPTLAFAQEPVEHQLEIVVVAMTGGILFVLTIIGMTFYLDYAKGRQRAALITQFLEKGQPVPPELWGVRGVPPRTGLSAAARRRVYTHRGIAALCWGLGLSLFSYWTSGGQLRAFAWAVLLFFVSAGAFINAWLAAREMSADAQRSGDPPGT
jgi:uncharacterized protein DUF6249